MCKPILFIEDDKYFAEFIRESFIDYDLCVIDTLAKAKEWLKINKPQIVFVDLNLPDSYGINTLRELSAVTAPKVVLSATTNIATEAARLGACDYIVKGDVKKMIARMIFNLERTQKPRRERFSPYVFEGLQACLARDAAVA